MLNFVGWFLFLILFFCFIILPTLRKDIAANMFKKRKAYDGKIVISITNEGKKLFSLELLEDPDNLEKKKSVVFQIVHKKPSVEK